MSVDIELLKRTEKELKEEIKYNSDLTKDKLIQVNKLLERLEKKVNDVKEEMRDSISKLDEYMWSNRSRIISNESKCESIEIKVDRIISDKKDEMEKEHQEMVNRLNSRIQRLNNEIKYEN